MVAPRVQGPQHTSRYAAQTHGVNNSSNPAHSTDVVAQFYQVQRRAQITYFAYFTVDIIFFWTSSIV